MRRPSVVLLLVGLLGGLAAMHVLRPAPPAQGTDATGSPSASASVGGTDSAGSASQGGASASSSPSGGGPSNGGAMPVSAPPQQAVRLERALRVYGLGWPAVAGCVLANGGLGPTRASLYPEAELRVQMQSVDEASELARALARGGGHDQGADAIAAPLGSVVPILAQLSALRPVVVYATGWHIGAATLMGPVGEGAARGPLMVDPSASALVPSLFAARLGGYDFAHGSVRPPSQDPAAPGTWLVREPGTPSAGPPTAQDLAPLLATAAIGRLDPVVVVTTEDFLGRHEATLVRWLKGCLTGAAELSADPSRAIRRLGSFEGAPEPADLVSELASLEECSLRDNVRLFGLAGRPVLTMDETVSDVWALLHQAGIVAAAEPDRAPVSSALVAAAARAKLPLEPTRPSTVASRRRCPSESDEALELRLAPRAIPEERRELARTIAKLATGADRVRVVVELPPGSVPDDLLHELGERYDVSLACLTVRPSADQATTHVHVTLRSEL